MPACLLQISLSAYEKSLPPLSGEKVRGKKGILSCFLFSLGNKQHLVSKAVFFFGFCFLIGVEESGYRHSRGNKACGLLTGLVLISSDLTRVTLELQY